MHIISMVDFFFCLSQQISVEQKTQATTHPPIIIQFFKKLLKNLENNIRKFLAL